MSKVLIFILLFIPGISFARNDTARITGGSGKVPLWMLIVPPALVSYGIATRVSPALLHLDQRVDYQVLRNIGRKYPVDDYIQYVPYAGIYVPGLFGIKSEHNLIDKTLVLGASLMICTSSVQISKRLTGITRPDGSNHHSFPSGHTATAFLGAHISFREYRNSAPWIGITGYGFAMTTGILRIMNRKHWLSDVLAGAGIGIMSVELAYMMLPVYNKILKVNSFGIKNRQLAINPLIGKNGLGIGVIMVF
ncbi:MAG: phosphatase PAP2 family protein [Dysgonamonadaceae bacterium]|nr:phosphatase PAP2 family protein [Dysgonamonadaceae bacterium]